MIGSSLAIDRNAGKLPAIIRIFRQTPANGRTSALALRIEQQCTECTILLKIASGLMSNFMSLLIKLNIMKIDRLNCIFSSG